MLFFLLYKSWPSTPSYEWGRRKIYRIFPAGNRSPDWGDFSSYIKVTRFRRPRPNSLLFWTGIVVSLLRLRDWISWSTTFRSISWSTWSTWSGLSLLWSLWGERSSIGRSIVVKKILVEKDPIKSIKSITADDLGSLSYVWSFTRRLYQIVKNSR